MAKKIFYGWWIILACFFISLYVASVVFYGFTAFFKPIKEEFGWSYTNISLAASFRGLEMGIFSPIIGFLVDRFGSRKMIFCGTIIIGFGLILMSLTQSLAIFYGSFFLIAFGAGGCTSVVTMTVVANWFHKNVGKALGIMASGFGASGLIVPIIVRLIDIYQWRTTLIILGLGMWAIGIPLSLVIHNKPEEYGYYPDGGLSNVTMTNQEAKEKEREISFKEILNRKSFLYLNIAELIRFMSLSAIVTHVMPYLSSVGISRSAASLVAAAIPLCSIIGRFGFGWLGDVFDKRYVMASTFFFMSMGTLAFCYVNKIWVTFLFLILFSPGFGGSMVLRGALIREHFGRESFGKMVGVIMGTAAVGGIIGPPLAGWVFDTLESYHLIWLFFCLTTSFGAGLILRVK